MNPYQILNHLSININIKITTTITDLLKQSGRLASTNTLCSLQQLVPSSEIVVIFNVVLN